MELTLQETRFYKDAKEDGERSLILRQLTRRVEKLPDAVREQVQGLPIDPLELLGEALLDFSGLSDLGTWLQQMP